MYRVMLYKSPYTPKENTTVKEKIKKVIEDPFDSSIRRTKRNILDLVLCNDFDLFVTFTFDPAKVNRYDITAVYLKMTTWLYNQQRNAPDFKYLIVPERHKDGALHFHAVMSHAPFKLKKTNVIQDSRRVFNVSSFYWGFTNATHLDVEDKLKTANYISKYITKDMITTKNRRRYWASRNLQKPLKYYNEVYNLGINPLLDHKTHVHTTEFNDLYEVPKNLFDR